MVTAMKPTRLYKNTCWACKTIPVRRRQAFLSFSINKPNFLISPTSDLQAFITHIKCCIISKLWSTVATFSLFSIKPLCWNGQKVTNLRPTVARFSFFSRILVSERSNKNQSVRIMADRFGLSGQILCTKTVKKISIFG